MSVDEHDIQHTPHYKYILTGVIQIFATFLIFQGIYVVLIKNLGRIKIIATSMLLSPTLLCTGSAMINWGRRLLVQGMKAVSWY